MDVVTDPYFSQANCCAERAVQVALRMMKKSDLCSSLLAYRCTPTDVMAYSQENVNDLHGEHTLPVLKEGQPVRIKLPMYG